MTQTPLASPAPGKLATIRKVSGLSPEYAKFVTAAVGQGIAFASLYYGSNLWVAAAVAVASALGVRAVPNRQGTVVVSSSAPGGPE